MLEMLARPFKSVWGWVAIGVVVIAIVGVAVLSTGGPDEDDTVALDITPTPAPTATPEPTSTPEPTPTATPAPTPTPTPTPTPGPVSPLNGTDVDGPINDRILTVKIDNADAARPQSGIQHADMMIEIWVEGITRFLSVWHYNDAEFLGPIRSMRPTDFAVQNPWASSFVNSGGQPWVAAIGNASNVNYFVEPRGSFRISSRFAPHNLYGDTTVFRTLDGRGDYEAPLEPIWNFGDLGSDAADATLITTNWRSGYVVKWTWNGSEYLRTTFDTPHNYFDDENVPQQIAADTLVMLEMDVFSSNGGGAGSTIPISDTVGSGTAWVFSGGKMEQGTWSRENETEWFTLTGADGDEMTVPPGRLWLVLPITGGVVPS